MGGPAPDRCPGDRDHSPWNWLLIVPIVLPLITVFFDASSPDLLGFPRFYWQQLAYILVGVATTTLVHRMAKRRNGESRAVWRNHYFVDEDSPRRDDTVSEPEPVAVA